MKTTRKPKPIKVGQFVIQPQPVWEGPVVVTRTKPNYNITAIKTGIRRTAVSP